jgi:hypothetical protein
MLVRARAVTPADVEEAVGWQVLYGGRLGTNLLELGLVDEKILAESLGRQLACEWTSGEIEISESMVQAIPGVIARRHEVVPWRIDGKRLKVLCIAPAENMALFDEMGFRLGKLVKPVIAPEFRIHQVLRRYFESVRQMRALDFGVKPKGKRAQEAEKRAEQAELEKSADLMDDEAFTSLYAEATRARPGRPAGEVPASPPVVPEVGLKTVPQPRKPAPAPAPPTAKAPPAPAASPRPGPPPGWSGTPAATPPSTARPVTAAGHAAPPVARARVPAPPAVVEAPAIELELDEEILDAELIEAAPEEERADALATDLWAAALKDLETEIAEKAPPPPPPRDMSPLSFQDALAHVAKAGHRDEVARTVLRYARSKAKRAVLLSIQGDVALGWDAAGDDLTQDIARMIAFPLTVPSAFRLVRDSRSHYIGPLGKDPGNVRFLKLAGKKWPASAVLLPVLFRGRLVYILYVDNGHKQHVDADVGELLILSQNISRSMEQMVARKQSTRA